MKTQCLYLLLLPILFCQSCEKLGDGGCGGSTNSAIDYFYLTEAAIKQTPYFTNKAFDTISFASDKGDTLTFVKTKTDTLWFDEKGSGDPDCGYSTNRYQQLRNTYATIKGNGSFEMQHVKQDGRGNFETIIVLFNNIEFLIDPKWLNPSAPYKYKLGTLNINNKQYQNTIYAYTQLVDTSSNSIIINNDFGCIVFHDKLTNTKMYLR